MKQTFLKTILLLCIAMFFINCEKENQFEQEQLENKRQTNPFNITTIESSKIQTNTNLFSKLTHLNNKLSEYGKTSNKKGKHSTKYDFTVNTDISKYIESTDGSYHSYTFLVNRSENNGKIENLVVSLEPDGSYKMLLMAYDLTIADKQNLQQVLAEDLSEKVTTTLIEDDNLASTIFSKGIPSDDSGATSNLCFEVVYTVTWCGEGNHDDGIGTEEDPCGAPEEGIRTSRYCTGGGGTYTGSDGGSGQTGGTSSGGGSGDTAGSISTDPVTTPLLAWEAIEACMGDNLSSDNLAWLQTQNDNEILPIFFYLNDNRCSDEAKDFAKLAIEVLRDDEDLDFEKIVNLYIDLQKECQAKKIANFTTQSKTKLTNLITQIFFGNDDFNLQISDVDISVSVDANANTRLPASPVLNSDNGIVIEFDNTYLDDATDLSIALTTAHEFVHAYLAYLYIEGELLSYNSSYTELNNAFSTFYNNQNTTNGITLGNKMHDVYDDFLDMITDSVFAYATNNNNIPGATEDYCRKFVLGEHQNTDAFQALTPTEQTECYNITINENEGKENAKGTPCE